MGELLESQENCIQDIQGQSSAEALKQLTISKQTEALDSDKNQMSGRCEHKDNQETSEGMLYNI